MTSDRLKSIEQCARQIGHVDRDSALDMATEIRRLWQAVAENEGLLIDPDPNPFP